MRIDSMKNGDFAVYGAEGSLLGFVTKRGAVRVSRPAGSGSRSTSTLRRHQLEDAKRQLFAEKKIGRASHAKAEKDQQEHGMFVVELSDNRSKRFHSMRTEVTGRGRVQGASEWAEEQIQKMGPGATALFYHSSGVYAQKPFSALKVNEYGHVLGSSILEHANRPSRVIALERK
jgi:hypothetical protein